MLLKYLKFFDKIIFMDKKIYILLCICLLFTSCFKTESQNEEVPAVNDYELSEKKTEVSENVNLEKEELSYEGEIHQELSDFIGEIVVKGNGASLFDTKTCNENIEIRKLPSSDSELVYTTYDNLSYTIAGFSDSKDILNEEEGYWVFAYGNDEESQGKSGWIFSKNIFVSSFDEVSNLEFVSAEIIENKAFITIELFRNKNISAANKIETVVTANKGDNNFYYFTWNDTKSDFFYTDPVGVFSWNQENNEIKHVSYHTTESDTKWTVLSNDFAYIIEDCSLNSDISEFSVYDSSTEELVFYGRYFEDINLDGHEVTIVVNPETENNLLTDEMLSEFEKYKEISFTEEEVEAIENGNTVLPLIRCRYNFTENTTVFIDCLRIILY